MVELRVLVQEPINAYNGEVTSFKKHIIVMFKSEFKGIAHPRIQQCPPFVRKLKEFSFPWCEKHETRLVICMNIMGGSVIQSDDIITATQT